MVRDNQLYVDARKTHMDFPLVTNASFNKEITVNTENECHQTPYQPAQRHLPRLKGTQDAFCPQAF